jgi:molybdopterin-containing oxidoreductase family membrane subunit
VIEAPVLVGSPTDAQLTEQLLSPVYQPRSKGWWGAFGLAGLGVALLLVATYLTLTRGIGMWGNNIPVGWAFGIINFVWWIGIGHAGTFISAILLLLEQTWRTSINRFAEAMTLFAVMQAGFFPLMHLGRAWFFYWLVPYPSTMGVWPQFRSALPWDGAAVGTYFTVSLLFWYVGLIPDLASLRDYAPTRTRRILYGIFALGWRGSARHYRHYRLIYGLLAGIATPLVLSVHSIVSSDFATAILPGWHSTLFPPFFVAGAIFSGFAMVATLLVPARRIFNLYNVVTPRHLDNLGKMILVTGWVVIYSYVIEDFLAWYSASTYERYQFLQARPWGENDGVFWAQQLCNIVVPQFLWSKRIRTNPVWLFVISIFVNIGMWSERFVIIVMSLQRDFLPSSWHGYAPTWVDWSLLLGTFSAFILLFMAFLRLVPFIPVAEVKEMNHHNNAEHVA